MATAGPRSRGSSPWFDKRLRHGPKAFSWFICRMTSFAMRELFMALRTWQYRPPADYQNLLFNLLFSMRTTRPSSTHLVMIPSYNPGERVYETVRSARENWNPVWVIVDGSTDDSAQRLQALAEQDDGLRVIVLPHNQGKGAAVLIGLAEATRLGFTHVLTMDSDGQHPANLIARFMATSQAQPGAMVLGLPKFDSKAPKARVYGRRLSNACANLETLWSGIGDSLYGFRVYPVEPLREVMSRHVWMRRFDFDPEAAVRLCWQGVRPIRIEAPVRYFRADEGGVSHFNYLRDNLLLSWMHLRLFCGFLLRLPVLIPQRLRQRLDQRLEQRSS